MLDELCEYKQYTSVNNDEEGRLKYATLIKNNYSGYGRALSIIARYFWFKEYKDLSLNEKLEKCTTIMSMWSAPFHEDSLKEQKTWPREWQEHPELMFWLNRYITAQFIEKRAKDIRIFLKKDTSLNIEEVDVDWRAICGHAYKISERIKCANKYYDLLESLKENEREKYLSGLSEVIPVDECKELDDSSLAMVERIKKAEKLAKSVEESKKKELKTNFNELKKSLFACKEFKKNSVRPQIEQLFDEVKNAFDKQINLYERIGSGRKVLKQMEVLLKHIPSESKENWSDHKTELEKYIAWLDTQLEWDLFTNSLDKIKAIKKCLGVIQNIHRGRNVSLYADEIRIKKDSKNDYNQITYQSVLAEAVELGPLKRYYLVCKSDGRDQITKKHKDKKVNDNDYDKILKLTAAYLLEKNRKDSYETLGKGEEWININLSDVNNWTISDLRSDRDFQDNQFIFEYKYKSDDGEEQSKPIFEKKIVAGNVALIQMCEKWQSDCDWKVIPEDKLDVKDIYYSDNGSNKVLAKNVKYDPLKSQ